MATPKIIIAQNSLGLLVGPDADTFSLSGENCPALCELVSCDAPQEWDVRRGYGLSWATLVPAGEQLSKPVFKIRIWEGKQRAAWIAWAAKYLSRPAPATPSTTATKSLGFSHPEASGPPFNVSSVVVLDVKYTGREQGPIWTYEVSLLEWKQPLPAPPRPDQSTPSAGTGAPSASDARDQEILDAASTLSGDLDTSDGIHP